MIMINQTRILEHKASCIIGIIAPVMPAVHESEICQECLCKMLMQRVFQNCLYCLGRLVPGKSGFVNWRVHGAVFHLAKCGLTTKNMNAAGI